MHYNYDLKKSEPFDVLDTGIIFQWLSSGPNEEQTNGFINATGDYSDTGLGATDFSIKAPLGYHLTCNRMIISVIDSGAFDSGDYGNGITLTNGILLVNCAVIDSIPFERVINSGYPIKVNPDWAAYCYDARVDAYGQGDSQLSARWTFAHAGRPVILDGDIEECFSMRFNDNLTGLNGHYFNIQGLLSRKKTIA